MSFEDAITSYVLEYEDADLALVLKSLNKSLYQRIQSHRFIISVTNDTYNRYKCLNADFKLTLTEKSKSPFNRVISLYLPRYGPPHDTSIKSNILTPSYIKDIKILGMGVPYMAICINCEKIEIIKGPSYFPTTYIPSNIESFIVNGREFIQNYKESFEKNHVYVRTC